jgi:SpoVK/Ycf46/Vps4 family AAA+-type ATPase
MATADVQRQRAENGLPVDPSSMHLVFSGNPGTGKTTSAQLLGRAYHALGLLEKPDVKTVTRTDLVAEYEGQSGPKVRAAFDKAKGGVLFIDEAYDLVNDERDKYGKEALTELMQLVENNRDNTVVIMAGYTADMDRMLSANPGARSRFPKQNTIPFPDYTTDERVEIASRMFASKHYQLDANAQRALQKAVAALPTGEGAGNARDVRNVYDAARKAQAQRLAGRTHQRDVLREITAEDIKRAARQ